MTVATCFCPPADYFRCTDPDCPNAAVNAEHEDYDADDLPDDE